MTYYRIIGEQRGFLSKGSMVIDENVEKKEAEELLIIFRSEMPLWQFWLEEQEFIDEKIPQSVCSEP